jgi:hypothetical protein
MTTVDWLPKNHEALYNKSNQTTEYLTADGNAARMGLDGTKPAAWLATEFYPKQKVFKLAFEDWVNPAKRTAEKTTALKAAENEFIPVYRQFYTAFIRDSPFVTDVDLTDMGFPLPSSGRHPAPDPTTGVEARVEWLNPGELLIHFKDKLLAGIAKPPGVHGAEFLWDILDEPPKKWNDLKNSVFSTRTPIRLFFEPEQRGKTVYFIIRWENTVGKKGPWSEIYKTTIP